MPLWRCLCGAASFGAASVALPGTLHVFRLPSACLPASISHRASSRFTCSSIVFMSFCICLDLDGFAPDPDYLGSGVVSYSLCFSLGLKTVVKNVLNTYFKTVF